MATFTNRATLSYNGRTTESNTVVGTYAETLSMTKTATPEVYGNNTIITYVLGLVNAGTTPLTALTVTDDLGGYTVGGTTVYPLDYVDGSLLYYVNGVLQPTPILASEQPLTITGVNVPAGGNAVLVYRAAVTSVAPPVVGGTIVNTVTATGTGLAEPVQATETVTAAEGPELTITKALSPTVVAENGAITYTLTVQNVGNTETVATDDVVITDVFDPILDITSVTLNGVVLTAGTDYTYDAVTGIFATVPGVVTVPAATYTVAPDGSYVITPGTAVLAVNGTLL